MSEDDAGSKLNIKLDATEALNKLTDAGIRFFDGISVPAVSFAHLVDDVLDALRGPLRRRRLREAVKLASLTRELQGEQGVHKPRALPPKAVQLILDEATLNEDDKIRRLWAQLIVNVQAGLTEDAYLFDRQGVAI